MIDIVVKKELIEKVKQLGFDNAVVIDKRFIKSKEDNRKHFEKKNLIMYNLEEQKKDFMHHRNSGLNQVLCKLAKKK